MIILSTAVFTHVVTKCGYKWEGGGAAWLFAAVLDTIITIVLITNLWGDKC